MTDIDFYVEAIRTRAVLGVSAGATVDEFESILGNGFLDDTRRGLKRRDYGLIEVHCERWNGVWTSFGVSLQVHRLTADHAGKAVPSAVRAAFGRFGLPPDMDRLVVAVAREGMSLTMAEVEGDYVRYVAPTNAVVFGQCVQDSTPRLWSIQL